MCSAGGSMGVSWGIRTLPVPDAAPFFSFDASDGNYKWELVVDLDEWEALPVRGSSAAEQHFIGGPHVWRKPWVRLVGTGPVGSLKRVAAKNAYWGLGKGPLVQLSKKVCPDTVKMTDPLCEVVWSMVKSALPDFDDEARYEIVLKRMKLLAKNSTLEKLLELDGGVPFLDTNDAKETERERKRAERDTKERGEFKKMLRERKAAIKAGRRRRASRDQAPHPRAG